MHCPLWQCVDWVYWANWLLQNGWLYVTKWKNIVSYFEYYKVLQNSQIGVHGQHVALLVVTVKRQEREPAMNIATMIQDLYRKLEPAIKVNVSNLWNEICYSILNNLRSSRILRMEYMVNLQRNLWRGWTNTTTNLR